LNDPRYQQIAADLRQMIESGEAAPGSLLPTEKELRDRYRASRNTVRDAVKILLNLGLVQTQPGRGTMVTEKIDPVVTILGRGPGVGGETTSYMSELTSRQRTPVNTGLTVEIQGADHAPELQLTPGVNVIIRHQQRLIDHQPYSLQTTFYPMELYERGAVRLLDAQNIVPGAVSYLTDKLGVTEVGWRDRITVRPPKPEEAEFFGVPADGRVPVVEIRRTTFQESGTPLRLTVTSYAADRNQFQIDVGEVPEPSDTDPAQAKALNGMAQPASVSLPGG
jgi:GntR family transcriptional regulator